MNWTEDQKKIIDARNCNLLVSAAAGSGKTAVLVERIIEMISDKENPIDVDQLLVVTFTKAAAAQMKDKIVKALEKMLESEPQNEHYLKQINYINQANILTIDSFCYKVVKEHFHVLGIDPGIRVGNAGELALLREEVLEKVIEKFYETNPAFSAFADAFSADKNDDAVEDYIQKIYDVSASYPRPEEWIKQAEKNLCTESEEEFLALPVVQHYFTEIHGTAEGIRERILSALEIVRGTDGPAYMEKALLSDIAYVDSIISAGTYTQLEALAKEKLANIGRGKKGTYDEEKADEVKAVRNVYREELKSLLSAFVLPVEGLLGQMKEQRPVLLSLLHAADIFREEFMKEKLAKNILEFSDMEHFALQVLCSGYDADGNALQSDIGREMSEDFREILIDEYQDSNYLQEAILRCVSTVPQGKNNIFMVGDVKQSIYSFRMARPDIFMYKYHTYETSETAACRKLLLKNNFRSRANVLEGINYIFYQIMGQDLGGIDYTGDEALVPGKDYSESVDDRVELLLGESKDFKFLQEDMAETGEKKEELDEELEDIGKMELEASMVAKRIEELMGGNGENTYQVTDADTGKMRDVRYGDMVILFRAPAPFLSVFYETLMARGIPVTVPGGRGYFDSVEIRQILSLLRVLDNTDNDVELAAVLRGYFGGFSNDDLALLALIKRAYEDKESEADCGTEKQQKEKGGNRKNRVMLYAVLEHLAADDRQGDILSGLPSHAQYVQTELVEKCRRITGFIRQMQRRMEREGAEGLLTYLYNQEGYYFYVQSMPEGKKRADNLNLLLDEALKCRTDAFCSVFRFLRYMDKLQKREVALGEEPLVESGENAVRIMSIHKSKGLEFPVVFLAGTGKNFNLMDARTPLIIHSDYFLGAKYRNNEKRCGNDTFLHCAMAALMRTESIAEELRIFYVGLTRSMEKLIITGVTRDIPALVHRHEHIAKRQEEKLSFANVHKAGNYLDFIAMALMRNEAFETAMCGVRKRMDKKGETIISAEYHREFSLKKPDVRWFIEVYDFQKLLVHHVKSGVDRELERKALLEQWRTAPAALEDSIYENLSWRYEREALTKQKAKLSVTEIKRIYETDFEPSDVVEREVEIPDNFEPPVPAFLAEEKPMNAAERGTWMHKTMELIDFANVQTKEQVVQCLAKMRKEGRIPDGTEKFITADKIYAMINSVLGRRMCTAAEKGMLYKEKQFVAGIPAERILKEINTDTKNDMIIVQGIIDACFQEGDCLILLDYKTDHIRPGEEEILKRRYYTQLLYYRDTLEQLTGLTVSETYIYSFALNKEVRVF